MLAAFRGSGRGHGTELACCRVSRVFVTLVPSPGPPGSGAARPPSLPRRQPWQRRRSGTQGGGRCWPPRYSPQRLPLGRRQSTHPRRLRMPSPTTASSTPTEQPDRFARGRARSEGWQEGPGRGRRRPALMTAGIHVVICNHAQSDKFARLSRAEPVRCVISDGCARRHCLQT
jgi:hypothetical protein